MVLEVRTVRGCDRQDLFLDLSPGNTGVSISWLVRVKYKHPKWGRAGGAEGIWGTANMSEHLEESHLIQVKQITTVSVGKTRGFRKSWDLVDHAAYVGLSTGEV